MSAKQKLSPPRICGRVFFLLVVGVLFLCRPCASRAGILEDAARSLARKVASVQQRDRRFHLDWQNYASLTEEQAAALRELFVEELGKENIAAGQEAGIRVLHVSIEETPTLLVLVASIPCASGEEIRISESPRTALAAAAASIASPRLLRELIWQQREPLLAAAEAADEPEKPSPLLLLSRENISLLRRETDHWALQDAKPLQASEKPTRDLRGEFRLSGDFGKEIRIILPGKVCDVEVTQRIALSCHPDGQTLAEGAILSAPCSPSVWLLEGGLGDWSVPDRLLLQNPSLSTTAPAAAELDLPGPLLSISTGHATRSQAAVVFNLSTGNYEVYRITLACGN